MDIVPNNKADISKKFVLESSLCTGVATFLIFNENVYLSQKERDYLFSQKLNGW